MTFKFHPGQTNVPQENTMAFLASVVENYFSQFIDTIIVRSHETTQIDNAYGFDLDLIGRFFNTPRYGSPDPTLVESDDNYRNRLLAIITANIDPTIDGISDMFETVSGLRPVITEAFQTKVYSVGEAKSSPRHLAEFDIRFSIDITKRFETTRMNIEGNTVPLGHSNIDAGGAIAAYFPDTDPIHLTDVADSIDASTSTMTLSGGPYTPGRKVDVEYEIIPDALYDTVLELQNNLPFFETLLTLAKAAGIKTTPITITKFITEWFQAGGLLQLTVTEGFQIVDVSGEFFLGNEVISNAGNGWDNSAWDVGLWERDEAPIMDWLRIIGAP